MQHRKLDMGTAWTQATGLMGANRDTISAIAGLFFFLPALASSLLLPGLANPPQPAPGADPEVAFRAMLDQISTIYAENWPLLLALTAVQVIGSMSLFALLTDRANPTVGEALRTGVRSLPSYLAAQLLTVLGASLAIGIPVGVLSAFGGVAVGLLALLVALVAILYVIVKLSLTGPVIAIEGRMNPLAALGRSWQLTKGNSLRILLFVLLLVVVFGIIALLVGGTLSLVLSAMGEAVALIGGGVIDALINALLTVLFLVVTVAIYRQLAGPSPEREAALFE
ncbi:glycerophosphoryl diester phosphodiesterase membrane domain-containing protein [Erythrobacter oryzae]|uniref:glycerophosphoryl diester phosphodiesterase membrane domain-containing protein n=1 Tax=Erythrobacter oryzae TaxID=3019556 RepID=UPI0025548D87|nr:glycerophosphoryl diester phosphodiesterase membrane domain-containing protein [Erythrobacter sp. COR-2]